MYPGDNGLSRGEIAYMKPNKKKRGTNVRTENLL